MQEYRINRADSPVIATAIHDGHYIPPAYRKYLQLTEAERFREEDPYTFEMASLPVSVVQVSTSRFYSDLNRTEDQALYLKPEDAWGLSVWHKGYPKTLQDGARAYHRQFYTAVKELIEATIQQFGHFFVLDIHSYNHRRKDPDQEAALPGHPEINLGTCYNRPKWTELLQRIKGYLSHCTIAGHLPDVRENIIFKGGAFPQWLIRHYGNAGAVVSLEFKKTFMDEWTGRGFPDHIGDINRTLRGLIPMIAYELEITK